MTRRMIRRDPIENEIELALSPGEFIRVWSGRGDLNARPPAPKAGALPGCATPRLHSFYITSDPLGSMRTLGFDTAHLLLL